MTYYEINGERFTFYEVKNRFKNVSFPENPQQSDLDALGIVIIEVESQVPTIEELKAAKVREIVEESDRRVGAIEAGYSVGEVKTFERQNEGAREILAGSEESESAQFVIGLLMRRLGRAPATEEKQGFATLICANYDAAKAATLAIVGTQQNLEMQIRAAATKQDVEAVVWTEMSGGV